MVDTVQDLREVPREVRLADQAMADTVLDQPSLAREVMEGTVLEVDQPREVRLVDQEAHTAQLDQLREARPAVQDMAVALDQPSQERDHLVDTVVDTAQLREVRPAAREMDTDLEVTRSLPREAVEEDMAQEVILNPLREAEDTDQDLDQQRVERCVIILCFG